MKKLSVVLIFCLFLASCGCDTSTRSYDVIPYPNDLVPKSGSFDLSGAGFAGDEQLDSASRAVIETFAARLAATSACQPVVYSATPDQKNSICFVVDTTLGAEQYKLDIDRRKVTVQAAALSGFLYAIQTIKQLLPAEVFGSAAVDGARWTLPCVAINDTPRFGYRGLMLDVVRHYFDMQQVKKVIDLMVVHKLNTLHWHLSDDQGWRIEIKRYPELTTIGSIRKHTMIGKQWTKYDNTPYGGYFTQEQIREVVRYAADHAITIIPEIDLPGHMLAALTCYPELGCTGGPYEVWGRWGVSEEVLCPGKEKTFEFLEGVLTEVMELFPGKYIHIGGDECPKKEWEKCPACQARIRELGIKGNDKHAAEFFLQSYVTERVEKFVNEHGRRIIGWDEMLEGKVAPDATIMSWRGSAAGIEAAKMGHDAIMTPTSYLYFDYCQSLDTDNEPLGIGNYVPIEKVYSYEPLADSLPQNVREHIIGVQANLWTEYIATNEHMEYMLLPRMAALSEVQWTQPTLKNWDRFLSSLSHMVAIYDVMGYNYAKTVFGVLGSVKVDLDKKCAEVTLSTQGDAPIRYTLDGTDPTAQSALYTAPVEIREACVFKAKVMRDKIDMPVWSREFQTSKALYRPVTAATAAAPHYEGYGMQMLTDGVRGGSNYADGSWVGWLGEPMDVTIDMGGEASYSSMRLGTLVQTEAWIFPPHKITVSTSADGKEFTEVGTLDFPATAQGDPEGRIQYDITFPQTTARYLRVTAANERPIPAWHPGAGNIGYLFTGEILVQ